MILEFNVQNLVTIPEYHTATDFFRPQLPRDLGIRQGQVIWRRLLDNNALISLRASSHSRNKTLVGNLQAFMQFPDHC